MGAYKSLTVQDIILSPFEVNKAFSFAGSSALTGSSVLIDRYLGKNPGKAKVQLFIFFEQ
jgi:hypothetical protein